MDEPSPASPPWSCWGSRPWASPTRASRPPPAFKAGFAERDITPEIGMEAPGGYGKSYHRSIHDPCKVRASVFDDGRSKVAIVGIDALGIRRETVSRSARPSRRRPASPPTRSRSSRRTRTRRGRSSGSCPASSTTPPPLVKRLAYEESTCVDPKYLAQVEKALVDAVAEAHDRRVEAKAGVGKGREETVAFNRRFKMRNGLTLHAPGPGQPGHHRAGRARRPGGRRDRRLGRRGPEQAPRLHRQLLLPRHHQPGRHLGQLSALPGEGHPGLLRQGLRRRLRRRGLGRRHAGRQPAAPTRTRAATAGPSSSAARSAPRP